MEVFWKVMKTNEPLLSEHCWICSRRSFLRDPPLSVLFLRGERTVLAALLFLLVLVLKMLRRSGKKWCSSAGQDTGALWCDSSNTSGTGYWVCHICPDIPVVCLCRWKLLKIISTSHCSLPFGKKKKRSCSWVKGLIFFCITKPRWIQNFCFRSSRWVLPTCSA